MPTFEYSVPGVTCAVCVGTIDTAIEDARKAGKFHPGIRAVSIDLICDPPLACVDVVEGMDAEIVKTELNNHLDPVGFEFTKLVPVKTQIRKHVLKGLLGLVLGCVVLGLCISGLSFSPLSMALISVVGTILTFYLGKDTYHEAFKKLKKKQLTMHTLFSISTLIAVGISIAHIFVPWLPMMFDTALLIFGFVHIGKAYEKSIKRTVHRASSYRTLASEKILVRQADGQFNEQWVNQVTRGQIVRIPKGQVIALNGRYLPENNLNRSTSIINPYSGSPLPQAVEPQGLILAGSVSEEDLYLEVSASEEDSFLVFLEKKSKASQLQQARLETTAARLLKYFIPTVLVISVLAAVTLGVLFTPLTALQVGATILASACPCTLGLIIPLAIKGASLQAILHGFQFANGEAIETAHKADTVVFDINGTLTTGEIRVTSGVNNLSPTNLSEKMLYYLAAVEKLSDHVFAQAIRDYIHHTLERPEGRCPKAVLSEKRHSGLSAIIDGKVCIVGSKDLILKLDENKKFSEQDFQAVEIPGHDAEHAVYLAYDDKIQGCILLSDPLRKEAPEVICALKAQGKKIRYCTGASLETANRYARQLERLGVKHIPAKHIRANCSPDSEDQNSKTAYIHYLKAKGRKVAMIGDGLNDSRAFEDSHFSIAIQSATGHQLTQDKAKAVIQKVNNQLSLHSILAAFMISEQTVRRIKFTLALSFFYNLTAALAISGLFIGLDYVLNPAIGAALMFVQSAFVLAYLQRLRNKKLPSVNDAIQSHRGKRQASTTRKLKQIFPQQPSSQNTQINQRIAYGEQVNKPCFYRAAVSNAAEKNTIFSRPDPQNRYAVNAGSP